MKGITTEQGRQNLEKFKMEAANEVGVNLKQGYNGDLTSRQAGSIGGQMVKKMIDSYKQAKQLKLKVFKPGIKYYIGFLFYIIICAKLIK